MEGIIDFFKKLFGDDFELKALSHEEGKITPISELSEKEIEDFFTNRLTKNAIWYDPFDGVLFSYRPKEDYLFKRVNTNAWAFKYIFYPLFTENWGGWWSDYVFHVYENEMSRYRKKRTVTNIDIDWKDIGWKQKEICNKILKLINIPE